MVFNFCPISQLFMKSIHGTPSQSKITSEHQISLAFRDEFIGKTGDKALKIIAFFFPHNWASMNQTYLSMHKQNKTLP